VSRLTPIDYRRFDKFLRYVGCEFVRQKGDHRIYRKANLKRPLVIPAIKDIPVFVILNNLRVLGISKEEYLSILNNL
jgi:predicted RNA binding protein YcfA (HicA-like mRNA interferase family)